MLPDRVSQVRNNLLRCQPALFDRICNAADDSRKKVRFWPITIPVLLHHVVVQPCYAVVDSECPLCKMSDRSWAMMEGMKVPEDVSSQMQLLFSVFPPWVSNPPQSGDLHIFYPFPSFPYARPNSKISDPLQYLPNAFSPDGIMLELIYEP